MENFVVLIKFGIRNLYHSTNYTKFIKPRVPRGGRKHSAFMGCWEMNGVLVEHLNGWGKLEDLGTDKKLLVRWVLKRLKGK